MQIVDPAEVFVKLGGRDVGMFPAFTSTPEFTSRTSYLTKPGVLLMAKPAFDISNLDLFLSGFSPDLGFEEYTEDDPIKNVAGERQSGTELIKMAGQLCYMSFGNKRSKNAEAQKYANNILSSGHGSVLEHANYSLLLFGAGRDFTHELVRHRAGCGFSQVSQRYVDGKVLRFVERPEYQKDAWLHGKFLDRIDRAAEEYDELALYLTTQQASGDEILSGEKKTEMRKKVNQCARSMLPNETEAPILFTGNLRALRHICEMRASGAADVPIREMTSRIFLVMQSLEPIFFADYKMFQLPVGYAVSTDWKKV